MKLKNLLLAVTLLAIVSAIAYVANRPGKPVESDPRVGQPLVERSALEKTAKLRLNDQGKTIQLAKQADGGWQVVSYYDFPADFSKLTQFVTELQNAKVERFVSASPERIARFEFKDTQITLLDSSDKELWSATLGKSAEGGGRLIRFGAQQKAYLSRLNAYLDMEPRNWADAQLVTLKNDDIAEVEIGFADAPAIVAKRAKKEDPFVAEKAPAGQRLKADKITSVLSTLTSLRFSDTTAPDDAKAGEAKQHLRTLKLKTFDGKTLTVAIGRKPEQKVIKTPEPAKDGKGGAAAILAKADEMAKAGAKPEEPAADKKPDDASGPAKAIEPAIETIPAGPVFAVIASSDEKAPINALMQKRAFQINDYTFTGLPQKANELWEPLPAPPAPKEEKPAAAEPKKS
ncbi:MAG: DUF4340 domain-containing protein [Opitutae bacterium]|nr:DUF4340 domain-containing protein [Opitutae bacterium]